MEPKNEKEVPLVPTDTISRVTFSPDSEFLLASSWDRSLSLYPTHSFERTSTFISSASILDCEFCSPTCVLFGGLDRAVSSYDFETNTHSTLGTHDFPVKALRFYRGVGMVLSGSWDMTMKAWDLRTSSELSTTALPGKVYSMGVSQLPGYIVVGTSTKEILIYDFRNLNEPIQRKNSPLKYQTRHVECMPNGEGYALGSIEGRVGLESFNDSPAASIKSYSFKCHRREDNGILQVFPVNTIGFHPVHGTFATGGGDKLVFVWDGRNRKRIWKLREFPAPLASLAFSPNGKMLAIACSYMYEEGDKPAQPPPKLFIRVLEDSDVAAKTHS